MIPSRSSRTCSSADAVRAASLLLILATGALPAHAAATRSNRLLIARPYPIEAAPSFPGGLFHWIDALAGTSNGKTNAAHQEEYATKFGEMTEDDRAELVAFTAARAEHLAAQKARAAQGGPPPRFSALLGVFCSSPTVEAALATAKDQLTPAAWEGLSGAIAHFRPKYEVIWRNGEIPSAFLERARRDPGLSRLSDLLEKIVRFYGVDPGTAPPPKLALVPVPSGYGTHAEAIGGVLLLEIRRGDGLADEAAVIVHETSHFLWNLVPADRKERLAKYADGLDEASARSYPLLGEAIPTALGQGVADRQFRPDQWRPDGPWYHLLDIDATAKRIYPIVAYALDAGEPLDERFLQRLFRDARPPAPPRRAP